MASIIQREAGGKDDMPIIAGIMWYRLNQGMNLEVDASVNYADYYYLEALKFKMKKSK